eukprot:686270-Pyramimonas_sp.AAC.1
MKSMYTQCELSSPRGIAELKQTARGIAELARDQNGVHYTIRGRRRGEIGEQGVVTGSEAAATWRRVAMGLGDEIRRPELDAVHPVHVLPTRAGGHTKSEPVSSAVAIVIQICSFTKSSHCLCHRAAVEGVDTIREATDARRSRERRREPYASAAWDRGRYEPLSGAPRLFATLLTARTTRETEQREWTIRGFKWTIRGVKWTKRGVKWTIRGFKLAEQCELANSRPRRSIRRLITHSPPFNTCY